MFECVFHEKLRQKPPEIIRRQFQRRCEVCAVFRFTESLWLERSLRSPHPTIKPSPPPPHFTFFVKILRKIPGLLKLVEEIYELWRKKKKKTQKQYRLWAHLSCHPYIRSNIILISATPSLKSNCLIARFLTSCNELIHFLVRFMTMKQQSVDKKNSSNYSQHMFRDIWKSGYNFINNSSYKRKSIEMKKKLH